MRYSRGGNLDERLMVDGTLPVLAELLLMERSPLVYHGADAARNGSLEHTDGVDGDLHFLP